MFTFHSILSGYKLLLGGWTWLSSLVCTTNRKSANKCLVWTRLVILGYTPCKHYELFRI